MADRKHQSNKKAHDKKVKEQVLDKGDRVLLRNLGVQGKHKLKCKWRPLPYIIVEKLPNLPVYRIKPERGLGAVKTVHRNHLLPIGYLVRLPEDDSECESWQRPVTRASRKPGTAVQSNNNEDYLSSSPQSQSTRTCAPQGHWKWTGKNYWRTLNWLEHNPGMDLMKLSHQNLYQIWWSQNRS